MALDGVPIVAMNDRTRPDDVSLDTALDVLSDERRRLVLEYLLRRDDSATVEELTDHVVAETCSIDDAPSDEFRSRVRGELNHVHLPKMHDAGLVDYDRDRMVVSSTDTVRIVEPYLEFSGGDDTE